MDIQPVGEDRIDLSRIEEEDLPRAIALHLLDCTGTVAGHVEDATNEVGRDAIQSHPQAINIPNVDTPLAPFCLDQEMLGFVDREQIGLSWPGRFWIEVYGKSIGNESRSEEFLKRGPAAGGILTLEQTLE